MCLKNIEKIQSDIVEHMNAGIICFDKSEKCIYANEQIYEWYKFPHDDSTLDIITEYWKNKEKTYNNCPEAWDTLKDGRYFHVEHKHLYNGDMLSGSYIYIIDQTDVKMSYKKERHLITHDELTGICNYQHFIEKAKKALADGRKRYLICSDIIDFKLVNELFGRKTGNAVLKKQAEMIEKSADKDMVYGRIADDRFAVLILKDLYTEKHFENCIEEVKKIVDNNVYKIQIYFGVYEINDNDEPIQAMCDKASLAINSIHGSYDRCIAYYNEELLNKMLHEKNIVAEFDKALKDNEFQMYLQPQISVEQKLLGAEALVRWVHADGTIVPPVSFIGVLENTGLIYKLDKYIWEIAAKKLKQWKDAGLENLHISVNISPKDFFYVDIYKEFTSLVEKYEINPHKLNLEITETAIIMDVPRINEILLRLQSYGFAIEIDDFGSGYSSLNMLKDINADVLKVDMVFLKETDNEERSRIILNMIISMAKQLKMPVITEGVENKEQVDFLTDMGCDIFQGYYFSRPVSVKEFENKYL